MLEKELNSSERKLIVEDSVESVNNLYALLIGINEYKYVTKLSYAEPDAEALFKVLIDNGYSSNNIRKVTDKRATEPNIDGGLRWLADATKKGGTAIIFFAGHGVSINGGLHSGEYLCPVDAEDDRVHETCVSHTNFTEALGSINADYLVIFLDTCHSSGIGTLQGHYKGFSPETKHQMLNKEGRVIITSCGPDEVSSEFRFLENTFLEHGLFTYYLLEGLKGAAANEKGEIRVISLYEYIYKNVTQHNGKAIKSTPQHPFINAATQNFIIAQSPPKKQLIQKLPEIGINELWEAMKTNFDRQAFEILCKNFNESLLSLEGEDLELKMLYFINNCKKNCKYDDLVKEVRQYLFLARQYS
ncbi:MAG: caspase family protein [Woronichinia naegeliana WA131]|jgi:hypothetical protein|uniref:Caspase family protein n=1 Tax=Woronichinia naegeliana WA131 TaxID=2824559 RepID=A0A977L068_9CYAN|nr:MAG: caspase family protein [Woronichinia naegeliana WA131]